MRYATGNRWLKFPFVVDADMLRDVLVATNPVLVIVNRRVPKDYRGTSRDEYIAAYSHYLDMMFESGEDVGKAAMETYIGLAASLDRNVMDIDEPVVNLTPMALYFDEVLGQLCTNVWPNLPLYVGMELSFPLDFSHDRDDYEVMYETAQLPSRILFDAVKTKIQKITKPFRVRSSVREHRTRIRISDAMLERMKLHPGLIAAGLQPV